MKNIRKRPMSITIATEDEECLPENLLFEILSWLPVKYVLRYKTVCRAWRDFISFQLCGLFIDQIPGVSANEVLHKIPMDGANIYGPCDGLYYLYAPDFRAIWNPVINEVRTLPPPITKLDPPKYSSNDYYGFGLNPLRGDYKLVLIKAYLTDDTYHHSVLVYSLWNDSWKYCGDLVREDSLDNNTCYIFVRGCCFWLGSYRADDGDYIMIIIGFMASDSMIQEIPIPAYDYQRSAEQTLGMHEDSLAFFSVNMKERSLGIWTLNDGTWTKIFNIGPIPDVFYPMGHWKSNKVLLVCKGRKLFLCDPSTREVKDLDFEIIYRCDGIFAYMESLVPVKNKIKSREDDARWNNLLKA